MQTDFLLPALREFGTGRELLVVGSDAAAPRIMALVATKRPGVWQTFQPSQLPLGALILQDAGPLEDAVRAMLAALPGMGGMLAITQQDPAIVARPPETSCASTLDYIDTARVAITGTFDDYWTARGKNLKHNVKRQLAKLAEGGVQVRFDVVTQPADVAAAMADYGRLESCGWKAEGGTAIAPDNAQGRFYASMLEAFCAHGGGRIYRCFFDDKVVAADLGILRAGTLVVLKTTYDEAFKAVSPASLLRHDYFRRVFEGGEVRMLEFYGKVMEWHLRWTEDVRTLYHVNVYRAAWLKSTHRLLDRRTDEGAPAVAE